MYGTSLLHQSVFVLSFHCKHRSNTISTEFLKNDCLSQANARLNIYVSPPNPDFILKFWRRSPDSGRLGSPGKRGLLKSIFRDSMATLPSIHIYLSHYHPTLHPPVRLPHGQLHFRRIKVFDSVVNELNKSAKFLSQNDFPCASHEANRMQHCYS